MNLLKAAWPFVAGVLLCEGVGVVAAVVTQRSVQTWYPALEKPFFTPPDWLFAPVWIVLYAAMGVAAALVWREGSEQRAVQVALGIFAAQLLLNGAWSVVFFGMRSLGGGLVVIAALWGTLAATAWLFFPLRAAAGWLLIPYLAWVTYAVALNAAIWGMN
ncbi:MAG: TspO protein [Bacteroidetes bacterium QS_9_68_14]|nr:MAG: TspO protein [Bacteroidetes bacterium QS_9_68_14]